jgi:hypothetical protein
MTIVDYSKAIIYKLCCNNTDVSEIYIGSTTSFRKRKNSHKTSCNNSNNSKYNYKVYQFIRANGGFDNWSMIQIEPYNATDKRNLETRERYHVDLLKPKLNSVIPTRSKKEQQKIYYHNNQADIQEQQKIYYQNNQAHIKEKTKIYREKNQALVQENNKIYRENNQAHIREIKNKKIECECGSCYTRSNKSQHIKSTKHQFYQNTLNFIYS